MTPKQSMPGLEPTTLEMIIWYYSSVPYLPYKIIIKLNIFGAKYLSSFDVFTLACILLPFFTEKIDSWNICC